MVRSINEIGHLTGKQTIAEFAENAEIIQMLTSLGVEANANRIDSSTARTCLVMPPIEM